LCLQASAAEVGKYVVGGEIASTRRASASFHSVTRQNLDVCSKHGRSLAGEDGGDEQNNRRKLRCIVELQNL
jgi:hypothetical protein